MGADTIQIRDTLNLVGSGGGESFSTAGGSSQGLTPQQAALLNGATDLDTPNTLALRDNNGVSRFDLVATGAVIPIPGNEAAGLSLINSGGRVILESDTADVSVQGGVSLQTASAAVAIAANTNNLIIPGLVAVAFARLNVTAVANLTGIVRGVAQQLLWLLNTGSAILTLTSQDALSAADNEFLTPGNTGFSLRPNGAVRIWYDGSVNKWRVLAP